MGMADQSGNSFRPRDSIEKFQDLCMSFSKDYKNLSNFQIVMMMMMEIAILIKV